MKALMFQGNPSRTGNRLPSIMRLVIVGLLAGLGCAVVGLLVGATIGGNLPGPFEFAGNRGYEATGIIGFLIGFPTGAIVAVVVCMFRGRSPS